MISPIRVSESRPRWERATWWFLALLVSLVHLFQNAIYIGYKELWIDEASTYGVAAQSFVRNLTLPTEFHSQPPLYYLLLHQLIKINSREWFLRGFSWAACLLLLWFVLFCLTEINRPARLFFCLFLIFNNFTHYLSQELRPYAMAATTTFISTVLFIRLVNRPSYRSARHYAILALVMLYTLAFDVWVLVAHGLYFIGVVIWKMASARRRVAFGFYLPVAVVLVCVAVCYLPYLALAIHWQIDAGLGQTSVVNSLGEVKKWGLYAGVLQTFADLTFPWTFVLYALMGLGVVAELAQQNPSGVLWIMVMVGQIGFVNGFLAGRYGTVSFRYYAPAFPSLWMLASLGVHHLLGRSSRALYLVAPALLAAIAWHLWEPFSAYRKTGLPRDKWRTLHAQLRTLPGNKLVFFDTGYEGQMLDYEVRNDSSITLRLEKRRSWSSGGEPLSPSYIEQEVQASLGHTDCFLYNLDRGSLSPYYTTFVPLMKKLEFTEVPTMGSVYGFCGQREP